ncbi:MAG: hypothetical protein JWM68_2492, partial [Verrucomicrobiales bacterium]|nr:hypothetical protein [Verrucomicrobiales bacterium]
MLFLRVLDFIMADAVETLDEHHHGRDTGAGDFGGVVQWAGREPIRLVGELCDGIGAHIDKVFVEEHRFDLPKAFPGNAHVSFYSETFARFFGFLQHGRQCFRIQMPLIQCDPTFLDNARDDAWFGGAGTDGADTAVAPFRNKINLKTYSGPGEESVLAPVHRRAAGMRGL